MYSNNKAASSYDSNAITVTPIKMEVDTSPAYPTQSGSGGSVAVAATTNVRCSSTVSTSTSAPSYSSISNANATADAVLRSGAMPKDKLPKPPRLPLVRKPPPTIDSFWPSILSEVRAIHQVDAKHQALPLARIKKIMKLDENAKMIAAEAPLLFAKACEYFIQELTMRAWIHTEESKRRTLQRSDIAQAIANYDQFDFLIDIVPREDIKPTSSSSHKKDMQPPAGVAAGVQTTGVTAATAVMTAGGEVLSFSALTPDTLAASAQQQQQTQPMQQQPQLQIIQQPTTHQQQLQYFIATPDALTASHSQQAPAAQQQLQIIQQPAQPQFYITTHQQPQQLILTAGPNGQLTATPAPTTTAQQQQNALLQNLAQQQQQQQQIQLLQQVVSPSGELTNVPIAINANQLNLLRLQMQPAAQQLLQLSTPANAAHNVQQQQQQQQQHSASNANIFLSTAQHQSAQNNSGTGASGHSIVSTDRNLGSTFRPNC